MHRLFPYIFFLLILSQYSFGQSDSQKIIKVRENIDAGLYKEAIDLAGTISDNRILNIHKDYFKAVAYYKIWEGDSLISTNMSKARFACEYYLKKYDDDNIEYYIKIVGFTNILRRKDMIEVLISDTTYIPTNPKYENALKYITALEYYQNKDYKNAYDTFRSVERGRSIDSQTDYYELMSLYNLYMNEPTLKNLKTELQKKSDEFLTKYNSQNKHYNPDAYAKVSNIYKSVTPVSKKQPYISLGLESGTIAPYGLRFEYGSKSGLGFFVNVRTSLAKDQDILSEKVIENKSEVIIGPSVRLFPRICLNMGVGMGYYRSIYRNDYWSVLEAQKTNYLAAYGGVTLKFGKIGISGGASFMDIGEALYKPEPTIGLTYQLK